MCPRVRCCCRSSPAEPRPRNGSKRAGPAAGSGTRLWSQTDRTNKGGAETIRRKEPPVRRRPTPGGGQAGRQADDKEGGGGGGRGRTTASASPAAVGFHGIVAQGREKTPPIVLEGYQDGMQVNFLSYPSTAATPVPRPPTDPLVLVAARPPHPPLMWSGSRQVKTAFRGGQRGKRAPPTVRRRHTVATRDTRGGDVTALPGTRILLRAGHLRRQTNTPQRSCSR